MSKRPKYSRWRRLPKVYRSGEFRLPDASEELHLLSLYLTGDLLDAAEAQATRAGSETVQAYCAELLGRALEIERVREQVADVEARRGPLEGLHEIANDVEYLAEWNAQAGAREQPELGPPDAEPLHVEVPAEPAPEPPVPEPQPAPSLAARSAEPPPEPPGADVGLVAFVEAATPRPLGAAAEVVLRHAGHDGEDSLAFLPALRRGEAVAAPQVAELARALRALEAEFRDAATIDRHLAYALHRLAFEAQVMHTDAWPGAFDVWTVDTILAVQEAVDRVLSGQDIHYFPLDAPPEAPP